MELKKLFKDIPDIIWKGNKEIEITGLTAHSKAVAPGNLFLAKRGKNGDGHRFIPEALAAGAVAVLTDTYDPFVSAVQMIHPHVHELESILAHRFYQNPTQDLSIFGITGTNGKTTTTFITQFLLQQAGVMCGLIGTVQWRTGKRFFPSSHTTPDFLTLSRLFYEMKQEGCKAAIMEVSSHALDQDRVKGIPFSVGVFTNLTQDHLDYHGSMETYLAAKRRLFDALEPTSIAILNGDDPAGNAMVQNCKAKVIRYGLGSNNDLTAKNLILSPEGMEFEVNAVHFKTRLVGRFNVYNILAAVAIVLTRNLSLAQIAKILRDFPGVPGRLERAPNPRNIQVFVDYAHTPDALKNVLQTLNEFKQGKIITVFGCGGDRDQGKRPQMGAIAESLSDLSIVTSDNPRHEDPAEIARQILDGFKDSSRYRLELNREKAIRMALDLANSKDVVLIAGKGHETTQIIGSQTIPFDDREIVSYDKL